jgi:hypothetical protein
MNFTALAVVSAYHTPVPVEPGQGLAFPRIKGDLGGRPGVDPGRQVGQELRAALTR